ncbi:MAG: dihydrofolate reductase [Saprospiraceae bacterium]
MIISAIVARSKNNVIGLGNQIPWYLPADLKYFKKTTLDHHVIMGRKTFESIGRPLPKRTNIVVTRDIYFVASGCVVAHSVEEALELAKRNAEDEAFIIGGSEIYNLCLPYIDRLYLTEVLAEFEGDKFFPAIDLENWKEIKSESFKADEKNEYDYVFKVLEKVNTEHDLS